MCDQKLRVVTCGHKMRCVQVHLFWLELPMCVSVVFFSCDRNFACFFIIKGTTFISHVNDDFSDNSFYLYFVSVRQKLEILGFLAFIQY